MGPSSPEGAQPKARGGEFLIGICLQFVSSTYPFRMTDVEIESINQSTSSARANSTSEAGEISQFSADE